MNKLVPSTLALAAVALFLASCASGDKQAKTSPSPAAQAAAHSTGERPLTVEESAQAKVTARVKSIDYATREVVLEDAAGRTSTVVATQQVQRLNDVHVGDEVTVDYVVTLVAELRPPTAEEKANPISAAQITSRAPPGTDPAGSIARGVKVVTTVEAVDPANLLVTLKGPMGDTMVVRGRKPENVRKLRVGDTIVITYVRGMALAVSKRPG